MFWQEIEAYGVARILVLENPEFEKDDLIIGLITWDSTAKLAAVGWSANWIYWAYLCLIMLVY